MFCQLPIEKKISRMKRKIVNNRIKEKKNRYIEIQTESAKPNCKAHASAFIFQGSCAKKQMVSSVPALSRLH